MRDKGMLEKIEPSCQFLQVISLSGTYFFHL